MEEKARGLMLNLATVDPDREDEFNRWYDEEHLPDVRRRVYEYAVLSEEELDRLADAAHPLRQELWKLYDDAVGGFARRTRRSFWQIHP